MQHMKLTASDVQEMSRRFQINCQSCKMHAQDEINIHVRTKIEKWLEDYRNGLKMKLRIQLILCFRKYWVRKIISDGVEASRRKSQAHFQII